MEVLLLADVGVTVAVPAVGVPEHGAAPLPVTDTLAVAIPPPAMVILPVNNATAVGTNCADIFVGPYVAPVYVNV